MQERENSFVSNWDLQNEDVKPFAQDPSHKLGQANGQVGLRVWLCFGASIGLFLGMFFKVTHECLLIGIWSLAQV